MLFGKLWERYPHGGMYMEYSNVLILIDTWDISSADRIQLLHQEELLGTQPILHCNTLEK